MQIRVKKSNSQAVLPAYAHLGDAGMDLVAISRSFIAEDIVEYDTGLIFEIPKGHVGLIFPRSSVGSRDLSLCNSVGVIDSGYRGSVKVQFRLLKQNHPVRLYSAGDRVAQIIILPCPTICIVESNVLSESDRSDGGFGSTGR